MNHSSNGHAVEDASVRSLVSSVWGGWDCFWFSKMDPSTLCFIRIFCGLLTFYVHLTYSWGLLSYVGPEAWIDHDIANWIQKDMPQYGLKGAWDDTPEVIGKGNFSWSVFYHVTGTGWIVAIHVFILAAMLLFAAGFATRFTAALTWAGAMCYVHRAATTVFGLDTMMMILLLYLVIGPSGATYSVDRWLQKWWARRRGLPEPPVQPSYLANFTIRLIQVHFCIIYLASGTSKLLGSTWWSGTSLNLVMLNPSFAPMEWAPYYYLMKSLATHRWLWESVMSMSIVFTLLLEVGFVFLIWDMRWRWAVICGSVMLHTGIALFMGLTTFSLMMIIMLASFIPPETIRGFVDQIGQRLRRQSKALGPPQPSPAGELVLSR